jgi:hypothetical protein
VWRCRGEGDRAESGAGDIEGVGGKKRKERWGEGQVGAWQLGPTS